MTALAIPDRTELAPLRLPERRHVLDAAMAGLNANTLRAYSGDVRHFAAYLGTEDPYRAIDGLLSAGRGDANRIVLGYRAAMTEAGLSAATIGRRLAALRRLVKAARMVGDVDWEIEVPSPPSESFRDTRGPGKDGWESMYRSVKEKAEEGDVKAVRDLAIVLLLRDLGLRRGEVCALDLESIDQQAGTVAVVGKGRTQAREHTLTARAVAALADWLAIRGTHPGPLFCRLDNAGAGTGRLSGESVRQLVGGLGEDAGVGRKVRPHGLRHQAITAVLEGSGGNIRAAMKFARHANPRTTMLYDDNREDVAGEMARMIAGE